MEISVWANVKEILTLQNPPCASEATISRLRNSAVDVYCGGGNPPVGSRANFHRAIACLPDDLRVDVARIYEDIQVPSQSLALYVGTLYVELACSITRYATLRTGYSP